jgi:hypothetical protein
MLEFVIILPIFLLLIVFIVDVSRLLMVNNAVSTATYRAAREAAIRGGADVLCVQERCFVGTFNQTLNEVPGGSVANITQGSLKASSGNRCSVSDRVVTVEVSYSLNLLTPGLATVLGVGSGGWEGVSVSAVARCEVDFPQGMP